jgi:hypothetical protein
MNPMNPMYTFDAKLNAFYMLFANLPKRTFNREDNIIYFESSYIENTKNYYKYMRVIYFLTESFIHHEFICEDEDGHEWVDREEEKLSFEIWDTQTQTIYNDSYDE